MKFLYLFVVIYVAVLLGNLTHSYILNRSMASAFEASFNPAVVPKVFENKNENRESRTPRISSAAMRQAAETCEFWKQQSKANGTEQNRLNEAAACARWESFRSNVR